MNPSDDQALSASSARRGIVNSALLVLAREAAGKTQEDVAQQVGVTQSLLSKYENDLNAPSEQHIQRIAEFLDCPVSFFYRSDTPLAAGTCIYHRKQASMPRMELRALNARINKNRLHVTPLLDGVSISPAVAFPRMDIGDFSGDIPMIAAAVRVAWRLPAGPIRNLIQAIERAGGLVVEMNFHTPKLSAISHPETPPMFFMNASMTHDRRRFTLAHEIGHLVMHHVPTRNQEKEADAFAAEFLMPEKDVKPDLAGMSLQRAAELKPLWRVSMASLIRRARDLKAITAWQYQKMMMDMTRYNWRKREPVDIGEEAPTLLPLLLQKHLQDLGYGIGELAQLMHIREDQLRAEFLKQPVAPRLLK